MAWTKGEIMVSTSEMKTVQDRIKKVKSLIKIVKARGGKTTDIEKKIENSTVCMMRDNLDKAKQLSEEALTEIDKLNKEIESNQKAQKKGLGKGLGALLGKEDGKPKKEPKKPEPKEEEKKEEPKEEDPNAKRKEEIKLIIDDWKSQGFNTSSIEKEFDKDISKLEEAFIVFSEKITKLEDLKEEFDKIKKDNKELLDQVKNSVEEIEKSLKDPDMYEAVQKLLKDLPNMLDDVKKMKQQEEVSNKRAEEIKLIVEDWKKEGYDVSELDKALSEPIQVLETKFIETADSIQTLMDVGEELESLQKEKGAVLELFGNQVESIKKNVKDIKKKEELELEFKKLKEFIKKNKDLDDIQNKITDLGGKGIDVDGVKKMFQSPLDKINMGDVKSKVTELESGIGQQQEVLNYLKNISTVITPDLESDSELQSKKDELLKLENDVKDMKKVGAIYEKFTTLKKELDELIKNKEMQITAQKELREQKLGGINQDIKQWGRENYKLDKLKTAIEKEDPIEEIENIYNDFKQKIDTLKFQNGIFSKLLTPENLEDFKTEIETIKTDILDPEKADEVTQKIIKLQYNIKQKEKEREGTQKEKERRDYIQRMLDGYKKEGYVLTQLEEAMEKDLDTLEGTFNDIKNRIQRIDAIKVELSKIDIRGLETVAAPIFDLFKDPFQLEQIEQLVKRLKDTVEKKNARRDEIKTVIEDWKGAGYDTTSIENALSNDIETLEVRFNEFNEKIEKLDSLKKELESLSAEGFEKKVRVIQDKMGNPENLESVIEDIDFLKREIDKKALETGEIEQKKVDEYVNTVKGWKDAGFKVDDLLNEVVSGPLTQVMIDDVESTRINVDRAEKLKKKLQAIKAEWVKEDVDLILDNLIDLGIINELEKGFEEIQKKLEDYEKSIGTYQAKINKFKEEGYITTRLESLEGKSDEDFAQEFIKFENDIKLLNQLREALVGLQNRPHPPEYDEVFTELFIKLADPDRITEIGQNLSELEKQMDELDAAEEEGPVGEPAGEEVSPEEISKQVEELAASQPKPKAKKKKKKPKAKKKKKKSKGERVQELRAMAKEAASEKDFEEAIEIWDQVLALDPGNKEAGFMKKRAKSMLKAQGPSKKKKAKKKKKPKKEAKAAEEEEEEEEEAAPAAAADGKAACSSCGGNGNCYWCNGSGNCDSCGGSGKNLMGNDCVSCKGTGKCPNCDGSAKCYWCGGTGSA